MIAMTKEEEDGKWTIWTIHICKIEFAAKFPAKNHEH